MSLNTVMNAAVSGLMVSQAALRATSGNIANVNTPNYARKVVEQSSVALSGATAGVQVAEIRRVTDDFLARELTRSTSELGRLDIISRFQSTLQSMFGQPEDNQSIPGRLDAALAALSGATLDATSTPLRLSVVESFTQLGAELDRMSSKVQELRTDADERIDGEVTRANDALSRIYNLNLQIVQARVASGDSTALEDQRAKALSDLSQSIGFSTYEQGNGAITVVLPGGQALVDTFLYQLNYDVSGQVGAETGFSAITSTRVDPVTLQAVGAPTDIQSTIQSGAIRGLIDLRDVTLADLADQIGEFAGGVVDAVNAIHNENTSVPAPAELVGRATGLLGTDAAGFTGQASFFVTDANNEVTNSFTLDFDTAGLATIDDIVAAINAGLGGAATASFTDGVLSIEATAAGGVLVRQDTPPSSRGGMGFSHFFGLNDLLVSQERPRAATGLAGADLLNFGATDATVLELRGPDGQAERVTLDFSTLVGGDIDDAVTALNTAFTGFATFALDADGVLTATPNAAHAGWKLAVVADTSERGTTGVTFSQLFGLGQEARVGRASGVAVRSDIAGTANLLGLARVDSTLAVGDRIATGDTRGAVALAGLASGQVSFGTAGGIGALSSKLADYASQIVSRAAAAATAAESLAATRQGLQDELSQRLSQVEGVNLDEELSNMISLQSAYNASARMITTVKEMLDMLLQL